MERSPEFRRRTGDVATAKGALAEVSDEAAEKFGLVAPVAEPATAAEPEPVAAATASATGDGLSKSQAKREKRRQRRRTRPHGRAR